MSCIVGVIKITLLPLANDLVGEPRRNMSCNLQLNDSTEILFSVLSPPLWYIHLLQTPAFLCVPFFPFFLHALCTMLITIGEAKTLAVYRVADKEVSDFSEWFLKWTVPNDSRLMCKTQLIGLLNKIRC